MTSVRQPAVPAPVLGGDRPRFTQQHLSELLPRNGPPKEQQGDLRPGEPLPGPGLSVRPEQVSDARALTAPAAGRLRRLSHVGSVGVEHRVTQQGDRHRPVLPVDKVPV